MLEELSVLERKLLLDYMRQRGIYWDTFKNASSWSFAKAILERFLQEHGHEFRRWLQKQK